ncbi:hypothetical protein [Bradyrhizobium japonicum]|uniref:hypothetical protein n=1 Tax=Bradyrhizobium japonicum TaxID=375 RepID=UPI001BA98023|nr:hypothetical protein [Bradyrhizobium japonicum]MBR0959470.1 hypothetical protein [Bradyrhizobium japonicum]
MTMWKLQRAEASASYAMALPASGRREPNTLMVAIKPDFIAPNVISAGFSSLCGLAKNARCT